MPRIHVFPRWRSNPYLNMLYIGARAEGWSVQGSRKLAELVAALPQLAAGDVLHIHWTHPICQGRATEAAARKSLDSFRAALATAVARGVRLVWTVHNQLPHSTRYRDLELELTAFLIEHAWRIIQLNPRTREAVAADYDLPADKLVTLRHASYQGIYPPAPDAAAARAALGISPTATTLGFVGQIRPYKGITSLLDAAGLLADQFNDLTVLLAGRTDEEQVAELTAATPAGVRVVSRFEFVPDADLGTWFAASDLMVFPYRRVLNSGSLLASATFGRPAVLPGEPHLLAEFGQQPWVSFFSPDDDPTRSLAETIADALPQAASRRAAALDFAAEYTTYDMAWDYVRILQGEFPAPHPTPSAPAAEHPDVSVVIPTHNVVGYVDELLRSVRSSQDVELEVLVVDDASTDGTWEVVQRHVAADPRVRAVRSPGVGGGQARNSGVELARGEYLAFADSDDLVPPGAYAAMLALARTDDSDLVVGDFIKFTANSTWVSDPAYGYRTAREATPLAGAPSLVRHRACWNRLAKREFWQRAVFPFPGVPRSNDIVTLTSALTAANRISLLPSISYVYRVRPGEGSMLSGVGGAAATISYLAEERTCAHLVAQSGDSGVLDEFWSAVLGTDTWYHLQPYLKQTATLEPEVLASYRRLVDLEPAGALAGLEPVMQAFHALLRADRADVAATLAGHRRGEFSLTPADAIAVIDQVTATATLSGSALDALRAELVPPPPPPPTAAEKGRPTGTLGKLLRRAARVLRRPRSS